jgi:histidinol-phosphatase
VPHLSATSDDPAVDDLTLARELADLADTITMARVGMADLKIETKRDMTPVTEADTAVEAALRARIAVARPDDAVVGEEFGASKGSGAGRRWIIDPIDGTKSYVRAIPTWSTLIALQVGDETEVGVVSMPEIGRRWWAVRGRGAFLNGHPIRVSAVATLSDAHLAWSSVDEWDAIGRFDSMVTLARACWRSRGIGDAWQYMLVAEGAVEIALDPQATLWDLAAPKLIVEEAGGRFTDLTGAVTAAGGSGLATNGRLHDAALSIVGVHA